MSGWTGGGAPYSKLDLPLTSDHLISLLRTLLSKSSPDGLERNYVLTVSQTAITFDYLPSTLDVSSLPPGTERFRTASVGGLNLAPDYWHHVAVTVYREDAAFYVNGTVVSVQSLEGEMVDASRVVYLGQTIPCTSVLLTQGGEGRGGEGMGEGREGRMGGGR